MRADLGRRCSDVVVVGAGLAGLAAMRALRQAGRSVLGLEARERIGGRVFSQAGGDAVRVDLGAQFISDHHRRTTALAAAAGASTMLVDHAAPTLRFDKGTARRVRPGHLALGLFGRLDAYQAALRLARLAARFRGGTHLGHSDPSSVTTLLRQLTFSDRTANVLSGLLGGDLCQAPADVSAYDLLDQIASSGGLRRALSSDQRAIVNGADRMVAHLAAGLDEALVLGEPVVGLEQAGDGVVVHSASGRAFEGRRVVLALPPQIAATLVVAPRLPDDIAVGLGAFRPGRVVKCVAVFDRPWWRESGQPDLIVSADGLFSFVLGFEQDGLGFQIGLSTAISTEALLSHAGGSLEDSFLAFLRAAHGIAPPAPAFIMAKDWLSDPHSVGGYASRRGPGGWMNPARLFAPRGRIHFAGTETADEWRSYMEGALQSAERAVKEILVAPR